MITVMITISLVVLATWGIYKSFKSKLKADIEEIEKTAAEEYAERVACAIMARDSGDK
jgi:hypothetical protein